MKFLLVAVSVRVEILSDRKGNFMDRKLPTVVFNRPKSESTFVLDWQEIKVRVAEILDRDSAYGLGYRSSNARYLETHVLKPSRSFHGYTKNQLVDWVKKGYKAQELLRGIGDILPLAEKRRYRYVEEGEEILVDRALSGEDNFMGEWTKKTVIPGARFEAEIMFSAFTSSEIVNAYNVWICRAIQSLDAAGVDATVSLKFTSKHLFSGVDTPHSLVKVKSPGEVATFQSFSPMLSPAAFRTFGFATLIFHSDSAGKDAHGGLGSGHGGREWRCVFNAERGVIETYCPYTPDKFPSEKMDFELREAIKQIRGGK